LSSFPETGQTLLRPDALTLGDHGPAKLEGILRSAEFQGSFHRLALDVPNLGVVEFEHPTGEVLPKIGSKLSLSFNPEKAIQPLND
jgi:hypothetical protein